VGLEPKRLTWYSKILTSNSGGKREAGEDGLSISAGGFEAVTIL